MFAKCTAYRFIFLVELLDKLLEIGILSMLIALACGLKRFLFIRAAMISSSVVIEYSYANTIEFFQSICLSQVSLSNTSAQMQRTARSLPSHILY